MTTFGTLGKDGKLGKVREIGQDVLMRCPQLILMVDHYRKDGTCRCDDHMHIEMLSWGYIWDNQTGMWTAPDDNA